MYKNPLVLDKLDADYASGTPVSTAESIFTPSPDNAGKSGKPSVVYQSSNYSFFCHQPPQQLGCTPIRVIMQRYCERLYQTT